MVMPAAGPVIVTVVMGMGMAVSMANVSAARVTGTG